MASRFNRYDHRCDFCGRFMPWTWVSRWNCFSAFRKAWCERKSCERAAELEGVW